jgi:hypothetical protein
MPELTPKPSEIAAWWGAALATIVFLWDMYKWRSSGARLRINVSGDMQFIGGSELRPDKDYVVVEVVNAGNKASTITHMVGFHYATWFAWLRRKPTNSFISPNPGVDRPLPHRIEPGARWMGSFEQTPDLESWARNGILCCGVIHSLHRRPVVRRVTLSHGA